MQQQATAPQWTRISPPNVPISGHELIGFLGTPRTGFVRRYLPVCATLPVIKQRIDDRPLHVNFITPCKQCLITDQTVKQKRLIRRRNILTERFGIREVHVHTARFKTGVQLVGDTRSLHLESQGDAIVWLNSHNQSISTHATGLATEHKVRRTAELKRNFSTVLRQPFARPEIERNALPCLLYTSPSPRDRQKSRMPSS